MQMEMIYLTPIGIHIRVKYRYRSLDAHTSSSFSSNSSASRVQLLSTFNNLFTNLVLVIYTCVKIKPATIRTIFYLCMKLFQFLSFEKFIIDNILKLFS